MSNHRPKHALSSRSLCHYWRILAVAGVISVSAGRWFYVSLQVQVNSLNSVASDASDVSGDATTMRLPASIKVKEITLPGATKKALSWNELKEILCPAGVPNLSISRTLFAMGRKQLGVNATEFMEVKMAQRKFLKNMTQFEIPSRFFEGEFNYAVVVRSLERDRSGPSYAFIYVPIWKAGNNSIWLWIHRALWGKHIATTLKDFFDSSSNDKLDACIVTAIRDPVTHFLSGYNEIEFRRNEFPEAERKFLTKYYGMPTESESDRRSRFEQFVYDLLLEDASGWRDGVYQHVYSMSRVLTELNKVGRRRLTSYVPDVNHLSKDFPAMVEDHCPSFLAHLRDKSRLPDVDEEKKVSLDEETFQRSAKAVWVEGGPVAKSLCVLHAIDYACWDKLPAGIPNVCQEVFESPGFIEQLVASKGVGFTEASPSWPKIQEQLCPASVPNLSLSRTLFAIARHELGVNATEFEAIQTSQRRFRQQRSDLEIPSRFFTGQFLNVSIVKTVRRNVSGSRSILMYVPIWNGAIRRWFRSTFADSIRGELIETTLQDFLGRHPTIHWMHVL